MSQNLPGLAQQHPLTGTRPVSGANQILYWLLDGVIFGAALTVLAMLAFIPYFASVLRVFSRSSGSSGVRDAQVSEVLVGSASSLAIYAVVLLAYFVVFSWMVAVKGQTPGMRVLGLRLVSVETGRPMGWGPGCLRSAVIILGSQFTGGILGLLFGLSPLFDTQSGWNQAWQDKLVKAVLIDVKNGRDSFKLAS